MRILVIEDEARLAEFVRQGLVLAGHVADGADNGATALEMAASTPYDAILLDLMLPGQNGLDRRPATTDAAVLRLADLELDLVHRRVSRAGQALSLTNREFALLELLLRNPNRVVTKTRIAEKVWEVDFDMGSNVIEVHLSQLRRKLDRAFPDLPPLLETVIGHGYRLHDPAAAR
uniref:Two-component system sensor histidine kinase/response regulator, putative n=1 Tax=Tanacetum cinerariifolium TaxID=118510 RepID=A0A699QSQ7_TANCI|nr:two-component system sensor histidine kinase/response regulator, putative [Tanacetum cinerariifolium]